MKKIYSLLLVIIIQISGLYAQNIPASDDCTNAPPICNFSGYQGNTSSSYQPSSWAQLTSAFCGTLENDSYVKFVADNDTINLVVTVTSSLYSGGIQLMIFESTNCNSGAINKIKCYNQIKMSAGPTTITGTGLIPGNTYYVIFDGFGGDVCDYTINVPNSGGGISLPASINASQQTICLGSNVSLTASGGNGVYDWSTSPNVNDLNNTNTNSVTATPNSTGIKKYVVSSSNGNSACPSSDTIDITVIDVPVINAGGSSTICLAGSATVSGVTSNTSNFTWTHNGAGNLSNTNTLSPVYTPNPIDEGKDVILTITANVCNSNTSKIFTVRIADRPIFNLGNLKICPNITSFIKIKDSLNMNSITWKQGSTIIGNKFSQPFLQAGVYSAHLVNKYNCFSDTNFTVTSQPQIQINESTSLVCENSDTLEMSGNTGILKGNWSCKNCPGSVIYRAKDSLNTGMKFTNFGNYTLIFTEPTCQDADTLIIKYSPNAWVDVLDYKLCKGYDKEIVTNIYHPEFINSIIWNTGSTSNTITVNEQGLYKVTVTNDCNTFSDSSFIALKLCDIDVPNTFSPNGDGKNEFFELITNELDFFKTFNITILNRWGNEVASYNIPDFKWDGRSNGTLVENGTYFYAIKAITIQDEELIKEGFIQVFTTK